MKSSFIALILLFLLASQITAYSQSETTYPIANIDYDGFIELAKEAQELRKSQLVDFDTFLEMAKDPNTIILDTRSKEAYKMVHIKGARHLDFSDFTVHKLARVIPSKDTRILIYCNNNFKDNPKNPTGLTVKGAPMGLKGPPGFSPIMSLENKRSSPLALNIPTFITLYGYGYKCIFELSSLVDLRDPKLKLKQFGSNFNDPTGGKGPQGPNPKGATRKKEASTKQTGAVGVPGPTGVKGPKGSNEP